MTERIGITASDMRLILDVVDRGRCGERGEHLPDSVLRDLRRLVPFDEATFQVMDPYRHTMSVQSDDPAAESGTIDDLDLWWPAFWEHCAYPLVSGNYSAVIRGSDDVPGQVAGAHWLAYLEEQPDASAHHVIVSLPPRGSTDRRLILWRESGPDFSERDVQLLTLLRPHLNEIYDLHQGMRSGVPELTHRQWEILRLVAEGFTNGQIARRLAVSEATVRKHLEHTFARLGVTNRTAAVSLTSSVRQAG